MIYWVADAISRIELNSVGSTPTIDLNAMSAAQDIAVSSQWNHHSSPLLFNPLFFLSQTILLFVM